MWKPGQAKPAASINLKSTPPPSLSTSTASTVIHHAGLDKNPTSANKATLSGSTMGMRFMKRSTVATTTAAATAVAAQKDTLIVQQPSLSVPLIGRRSFGNFNKAVNDNYQLAKDWYEGSSKKQQVHITDEELLQRYKDHRSSGRGDQVNKEALPIGNLASKRKRKR